MALPSQSARNGSGRVSMASRGKNPVQSLVILAIAAGACIGGYFLIRGMMGDSSTPTQTGEVASDSANKDSMLSTVEPQPAGVTPTHETPTPIQVPINPAPPIPSQTAQSGQGVGNTLTQPLATPEKNFATNETLKAPEITNESLAGASRETFEASGGAVPPGYESVPGELQGLIAEGLAANDKGDPLTARKLLSEVLLDDRVPAAPAGKLRNTLTAINDDIIFSPRLFPGDAYTMVHEFQAADKAISALPSKKGLMIDWRLIPRINRISNPNRVSIGQKLKLVKGPFHAIVHKKDFRMDVFLGPPESPSDWVYVRSFKVGLGEGGSTPIGDFVVRKNSKLVDPYWVNPRTGERFEASDPKNPIGERWIGLEGQGDAAAYSGYGIHGTIDPGSIGQTKSMGCVRLGNEDVEFIYELLVESASRVMIKP